MSAPAAPVARSRVRQTAGWLAALAALASSAFGLPVDAGANLDPAGSSAVDAVDGAIGFAIAPEPEGTRPDSDSGLVQAIAPRPPRGSRSGERTANRSQARRLAERRSRLLEDGTLRGLAGSPSAAQEPGPSRRVVIGGDRNYPPYEFLDARGTPAGFNVELTRAIAREEGLDVEIRLGAWSEVRAALDEGAIDAAQGMFHSTARELQFDFSPPTITIHHVAVVREGGGQPPRSVEELRGRSLVVMRGDIMHDFAIDHGLDAQLVAVATQEDALREVAEGRRDCALVARIPAAYWARERGWRHLAFGREPLLSSPYGFAVRKNEEALLAHLGEGLQLVKQHGEYPRIRDRWLGVLDEPAGRGLLLRHQRALGVLALGGFVLLALLALWAWSLRRQVSKKTEALQISASQFRALVEGAPEAVFVQVRQRFSYLNPAACRLFGAASGEGLVGRPVLDRIHPDFHAVVRARIDRLCVEREPVPPIEEVFLRLDGSEVPVEVVAVPVPFGDEPGALVFARDISERRHAEEERLQLEEQLRVAQRIEAIGTLAGGVAHDFNNLLFVISGYAEVALEALPRGEPVEPALHEIQRASERAAALTRQLLAFSRKQILQPVALDLNEVVRGVEKMLQQILGEDIAIVLVLAPDLGPTVADPGQIEQVIMNLAVNARDAMPAGGRLILETANADLGPEEVERHLGMQAGPQVMLAVSDTGCGMDEATRQRIFEPFFTTKPKGQGTGLGLSTVYGIVKQSGGSIWVYSEPGAGTTFKIYLPRVSDATETHPSRVPVDEAEASRARGSETILLVEDEEAVRRLCQDILAAAGYTVLAAAHGAEALEIAARHEGGIQLLLTDVVMPGMGGPALVERLRSLRPEIEVVHMSGYTDTALAHHGALAAGMRFVAKPLNAAQLRRAVRSALDGRPAPTG